MSESFQEKLGRLRRMLHEQGVDVIKLTLQKNVSWLCGGRSHVNTVMEKAHCQVIVTAGECHLLANNIEAERLLQEEFSGCGVQLHVWPWSDEQQRELIAAGLLADTGNAKTDEELESGLLALRTFVSKADRPLWRELGKLASEALEQTAFQLQKGQSEYEIAGLLAKHCLEREIEPIVYLVAADERVALRRHPLPTSKRLDAYAMLVVCARRSGMIASATRLVHFGQLPEELAAKHGAIAEIDARLIHATRPGRTLEQMYALLQQFYRDAGYPGEEAHHHQGGMTGYASREQLAIPGSRTVIEEHRMFAWNPSIAGVKSEDTIMTAKDGAEVITPTAEYPEVQVQVDGVTWSRPAILVR